MWDKHLDSEAASKKGSRSMMTNSSSALHSSFTLPSTQYSSYQPQRPYIEDLGFPFLKMDCHYKISGWNQAFLKTCQIDEKELENASFLDMCEQNEMFKLAKELMMLSTLTLKVEERLYEDDDTLVRVCVFPFSYFNCQYIMFEDLSYQKKFEHLLTFHHQMEAVSHIAAGVAHELRNPLSVIKGFLQLAKLTDDFHKYYDTILSELNRMNLIIEDFLSISRKKMTRSWQSPNVIIESLVQILKSECLLHDVNLQLDLTATKHNVSVHVNESMIKQVILNLLRNSIEAYGTSNTNRLFLVKTEIEDETFLITIKDNGKGMSDEVLNQLGKPFFTTKEKGNGIGIPLCKKIIEDHGGKFLISSEYNVGTQVKIFIPLIE
ncbi:two-component system sensor histidine kinase NtrB [Alkalicoccobacillus plakortidis]|uniref:histidine kinase n=1 Tax=Alkalicoccobacillus plakortidis TaxID=444060 RepID=A0ABT0XPN3_9BACI|nr:HAMP domain-containing sensor histidine kinase [Alkalicoccobacillus plakortidis]MCM2677826.1 HAMP domain-containing histidine kinase [Alkalicoccobacillus plakortidis]